MRTATGRAVRRGALLGAAVLAVACLELSGPAGGVASVTVLQPAWPSVVVGDLLRDSAGAPAPLRVQAFDGEGRPVADPPTQFIVLAADSLGHAALAVDGSGQVSGARLRGGDTLTADTVLAVVGGLQTPKVTIDVVPSPDSAHAVARVVPVTGDIPLRGVLDSGTVAVRVLHRRGDGTTAGVRRWIVYFELVRTLRVRPGTTPDSVPMLVDGSGRASLRDTTDATGEASRRLRIFPGRLDIGTDTVYVDTAVVRATVRRQGAPLAGASLLEFTIPVRLRPRF